MNDLIAIIPGELRENGQMVTFRYRDRPEETRLVTWEEIERDKQLWWPLTPR